MKNVRSGQKEYGPMNQTLYIVTKMAEIQV